MVKRIEGIVGKPIDQVQKNCIFFNDITAQTIDVSNAHFVDFSLTQRHNERLD